MLLSLWHGLGCAAFLGGAAILSAAPEGDPAPGLQVLKSQCFSCHNATKAKGGLSMATREDLLKGGESGAALSLDRPQTSRLLQVLPADVEGHMPPKKQLNAAQVALLESWVAGGAVWNARVMDAGPGPLRPVQPAALPANYRPVLAMAVSPDDSQLAVACGSDLLIFSLQESGLSLTDRVTAHPEAVESIVWLPGGKSLLTGGFRRLVRWTAQPLRPEWTVQEGLTDRITAMILLPCSQQLFAADGRNGEEGEIRELDPANGVVLRTWKAHTDSIYAMCAQPDGQGLATAGADHLVRFWNAADGSAQGQIEAHQSQILGLGWHPDGSRILTAGADRQLRLWNAATRANLLTITHKTSGFNGAAFSPDGSAIYTISSAGTATRYHELKIHSGAESSGDFRQQELGGTQFPLYSMTQTRSGSRFFAGSRHSGLLVWNPEGKLLQQLDLTGLTPPPAVTAPLETGSSPPSPQPVIAP